MIDNLVFLLWIIDQISIMFLSASSSETEFVGATIAFAELGM